MSTKLGEPDQATQTRYAPRYRVLIHNDDKTPMDFVVAILTHVFKLQFEAAVQIMIEAHKSGLALVTVEPLERAEFHVEQCKSLSSTRKLPLTFTMEPE